MSRQPGQSSAFREVLFGDPATSRPYDAAVRGAFFAGWALGVVAILGTIIPLMAVSGIIFTAVGAIICTNHRGFADRVRIPAVGMLRFSLTELRGITRIEGAGLALIGLMWLAVGIAGIVGALETA